MSSRGHIRDLKTKDISIDFTKNYAPIYEVPADKKKLVAELKKKVKEEKKSLWVRFRIFCHGVKSETLSVHWPSKKDMVKYSIATIVFVISFFVFSRLLIV